MSSQPPPPPPPSSSSYPAPTATPTDATTHTNVTSRPTKKRVIRSSRFQSQVNAPASSSAQAPPLMPTSASGSGTYESAFSYRTRRSDASAAAASAPSAGRGSGGERSATPSSSAAAGPSTRSLKKRRVAPSATTAAKTDAKDKGKGRAAAVVVDDDAMETSVPGKIRRRISTPPKDEYDEPGREDERLAEFSCPICYSPPVNPCVIACGHLLCYTCLRDSLLSTQIRLGNPPPAFQAVGEPFNIDGACPICRLEIRGGLTGRSNAGRGDDVRGRRRKKRKVNKTGAEQRDVDGVRVLELRVVDC